jgi:hypothetical protein
LGIFKYDSRSNLDSEHRLSGLATGEETVEYTLSFKSRPLVICSGGLSVKNEDIAEKKVKFPDTYGSSEFNGEL